MKNALIGGFALLIASGCGFASASAMSLSSHPAYATPIELVGWGDNGQGGGYGGTPQNSGGGYAASNQFKRRRAPPQEDGPFVIFACGPDLPAFRQSDHGAGLVSDGASAVMASAWILPASSSAST